MVQTSKAECAADAAETAAAYLWAVASALDPDDSDGDESEDDVIEILELHTLRWSQTAQILMEEGTRGPYNQTPKCVEFFSIQLQSPDREFRSMFRLGRDMFDRLVAILAPNPIFNHPNAKKPQRHVKYQLATFLIRYGRRGSDVFDISAKMGFSHGSVYNYCKRISRAIRQLRSQYLGWPSDEMKTVISMQIEQMSGFPKCIGCIDGSHIPLTQLPFMEGELFRSRKKEITVNNQVFNWKFFILMVISGKCASND
ncbi:hypothetical protein C8J56DRAFT_899213 [Mycena floridula]|nr:hypothetical protein C8J56DRAFT_899213 [Mycena floridula]